MEKTPDPAANLSDWICSLRLNGNSRLPRFLRILDQAHSDAGILNEDLIGGGDLQPVFATMLENGVRICDATFGNVYLLKAAP